VTFGSDDAVPLRRTPVHFVNVTPAVVGLPLRDVCVVLRAVAEWWEAAAPAERSGSGAEHSTGSGVAVAVGSP